MNARFRILFVGNSYTTRNDMPVLLEKLAAASDESIQIDTKVIAFGGASLAAHWNRGEVQQCLADEKWDAIVLQDQSTRPMRALKSMQKHVRLFAAAAHACGVQSSLYMTWARQHDPDSQSVITDAYRALAADTGASLVPVGLAWQELERTLPRLPLYDPDQSHPSPLGSYVAACVFFASLFKRAPTNDPGIEGLPNRDDLNHIHRLAWMAATQSHPASSDSTPSAAAAAG